jgi:hypothetical protein
VHGLRRGWLIPDYNNHRGEEVDNVCGFFFCSGYQIDAIESYISVGVCPSSV